VLQPQIMIEQLGGFGSQRQEAHPVAPTPLTDLGCRQEQIIPVQIDDCYDRRPSKSIKPTMAKSREVRKLDQNRHLIHREGTLARLGSLPRRRLSAGSGLPRPAGARC
jgi:hypothetical protein